MDTISFVWQCPCGFVEYSEMQPEDCPKCFNIGKFKQVPEDMIEEATAEHVLSMNPEEDEDD